LLAQLRLRPASRAVRGTRRPRRSKLTRYS